MSEIGVNQGAITATGLRIVDDQGRVRIHMGEQGDGFFGISIRDAHGLERVNLVDHEDVCRIDLMGKERSRLTLSLVKDTKGSTPGVSEIPWLTISDEFSNAELNLTSHVLGPALYLMGEDGHVMAKIEGTATNMPKIVVCDRNGTERVMLAETLGPAFVGIADHDGMIDTELSRENGLILPE